MNTVTSKDGTTIAFDRLGQGPAVILVDGALCYRAFGPMGGLAPLLAPHFTILMYDRRGRGTSGDTLPYAVEREIEDIDALIQEAGGTACVFGVSSGGALALETAVQLGSKVRKLAMYEPPYNADPAVQPEWNAYRQQITELLAAGRRGDTAACFMKFVGAPADQIEGMRQSPMWPMFEAVAPTLAYDAAVLGAGRFVSVERAASVTIPTLVMAGGASYPFMHDTAQTLAKVIPNARYRVLAGQRHDAAAEALAPELVEFFSAG